MFICNGLPNIKRRRPRLNCTLHISSGSRCTDVPATCFVRTCLVLMRHGSPLALRVVCASLPICTMLVLSISVHPTGTKALYPTELILHAFVASLRLPTLACATYLSVSTHNSVSIFLSQTVPPRPSQKVSKRNRCVCFELCYACRTSYSSMLLSDMRACVLRGMPCSHIRA